MNVWWLEECHFFVSPLLHQIFFSVGRYFSFGCPFIPCAVIKSRGRLKQRFIDVYYSMCSHHIENWARILLRNDVVVSLLHTLHLNKSLKGGCVTIGEQRGLDTVKYVALMYPSA